MSFKPEDLHPLAGIAVPTLIKVMTEQIDDKFELFAMFERSKSIINTASIVTALIGVASMITTSRINVWVFMILTIVLHRCYDVLKCLQWTAFDEAVAFQDAAEKIVKDFYGVDISGETRDTETN